MRTPEPSPNADIPASPLAARLNAALSGRYSISHQIGEGGMGVVFAARDLRHDRMVAVKVFRPEVAQFLGAERFQQEILIAARLDHPNIVMLIDSGDVDGLRYYVMPLVNGESLRDRLRREQRLAIPEALRIATQVADALAHAHRHGVLHRDIKPENILLADDHAKVMDFGIARMMGPGAANMTQTGMSVGTPAYMSPEQCFGEADLDGRSDLYSLGCVLFEMLSGTPPYAGATPQAMMARRMTQDAERIASQRADVPVMVDLLLARALSREPAERQASLREFGDALQAEIGGTITRATLPASPATAPVGRAALVGRDVEMDDARAVLHALAKGQGGCLLLSGEPGVGKTRLAHAILEEARARSALTLIGRCYEMEGTPPFTPFIEMLDAALRLLPARTLREALGDAAPEIARILPSLRQAFPDIGDPLDLPPDRQSAHLHAKYREFNERAARVTPLVILLDDLHWADSASLGLLGHMAGYLHTIPILIIGTYRDVDLEVGRDFARLLESLLRQRVAKRVTLRRLREEGVGELLTALSGAAAPSRLIGVIHAETDGNPFFVEELFQHLKEEGKLFHADGSWRQELRVEDLDVPEGVRLVIGRRLERLSETCRTVLTTAAVIGSRFSLSVLDAMGEFSEDDLLDALEAATAAHLIDERRGERDVAYAFSHELIRQTLLGSLSMPRRQRRHVKVAAAIEKSLGSRVHERPSDLAYHLYQAGTAADPEKTMLFLTLSAEASLASAAYREALDHCERAAGIEEVQEHTQLARLFTARGNALRGSAQWGEALAAYAVALDHALAGGDLKQIAESGIQLAMLHGWLGEFAQSLAVASRALVALQSTASGDYVILDALAGFAEGVVTEDYGGAKARFARAMEMARTIGDPTLEAIVQSRACCTAFDFAQADDAIAAGDAAARALRAPAQRQILLDAASHRLGGLVLGGRRADCEAERGELKRVSIEAGHAGSLFVLDWADLALRVVPSGNLADIVSYSDEMLTNHAEAGPWAYSCQGQAALAELYRGRVAEAQKRLDRARLIFPRGAAWTGALEGCEVLTAAYGDDLTWTECVARYDELLRGSRRPPTGGVCFAVVNASFGFHERGDLRRLGESYPVLVGMVDSGTVYSGFFPLSLAASLAAHARDDRTAADMHFARATAVIDRLDLRLVRPFAGYMRAIALLRRAGGADGMEAAALLESAIEGFAAIGATFYEARARALRERSVTS